MLRHGSSSRKEEIAVDMSVIDEEDELLMETERVGLMHVDPQRMIESALYVLLETSSDLHIKAMIKTKVIILIEKPNHRTTKGKRCLITKLLRCLYVESSLEELSTR